jgi:Nucleotidyl transferase AbiEii toxin, Type IV TA system
MPSDRVREILPPDTAATWDAIAPLVPSDAYLGGGTAIAVRLGHRISRDLDFFFHHGSVDLGELARRLSAAGPFAVTERASGTLNGVFSATKVQFLHADEGRPQHLLEPPQEVDGLRVAGLSDLMAMKLKVVGDRGELRDYFDLMTIEQRTGRTADEGLALFGARFQPEYPQQAINHILLGLGYFDDVDPDDALPVPRAQIVDYWTRRQREIVTARGRLSHSHVIPPLSHAMVWSRSHRAAGCPHPGALHRVLRARIRCCSLRLGWYPVSAWRWSQVPLAIGVSVTRRERRKSWARVPGGGRCSGPPRVSPVLPGFAVPGGGCGSGPCGGWCWPGAQPWAAAVPSGCSAVTHQRVRGSRAAAAIRSRALWASSSPNPAASPGMSDSPSAEASGTVMFTSAARHGPRSSAAGRARPSGPVPAGPPCGRGPEPPFPPVSSCGPSVPSAGLWPWSGAEPATRRLSRSWSKSK